MIDRRVQKTLLSLHQALIALILEKGYDATTVKNIIDRANVGRTTFYAHYLGKEQLLQAGLDDLGKVLRAQQQAARLQDPSGETRLSFSMPFFVHAHDYKAVYRAMVGKHAGAVVTARLRTVLATLVEDDLRSAPSCAHTSALPHEAVVQFVVGSVMSVLTWWVDEPKEFNAQQVDAIFRCMTLPALLLR